MHRVRTTILMPFACPARTAPVGACRYPPEQTRPQTGVAPCYCSASAWVAWDVCVSIAGLTPLTSLRLATSCPGIPTSCPPRATRCRAPSRSSSLWAWKTPRSSRSWSPLRLASCASGAQRPPPPNPFRGRPNPFTVPIVPPFRTSPLTLRLVPFPALPPPFSHPPHHSVSKHLQPSIEYLEAAGIARPVLLSLFREQPAFVLSAVDHKVTTDKAASLIKAAYMVQNEQRMEYALKARAGAGHLFPACCVLSECCDPRVPLRSASDALAASARRRLPRSGQR